MVHAPYFYNQHDSILNIYNLEKKIDTILYYFLYKKRVKNINEKREGRGYR